VKQRPQTAHLANDLNETPRAKQVWVG